MRHVCRGPSWPASSSLLVAAATATLARRPRVAVRSARQAGLPPIEALVASGQPDAAFQLLQQVQAVIPDDPRLVRLTNDVMDPVNLETVPEGVAVANKDYLQPRGDWLPLGTTPLRGALAPFGYRRWRLTKDGYDRRELAAGRRVGVVAPQSTGESPAGMVFVGRRRTVPMSRPFKCQTSGWIATRSRPPVQGLHRRRRYTREKDRTQPFIKEGHLDHLGGRHCPVP